MVAHIEPRQQAAFNLVLARSDRRLGPNLRPADKPCRPGSRPSDGGVDLPPCRLAASGNRIEGDVTMASLAITLRDRAGRRVIDRTGLPGSYRIVLETAEQPFTGRRAREDSIDCHHEFRSQLPRIQIAIRLNRHGRTHSNTRDESKHANRRGSGSPSRNSCDLHAFTGTQFAQPPKSLIPRIPNP
jgi:uncharacterized protein (TIGR03435 family)